MSISEVLHALLRRGWCLSADDTPDFDVVKSMFVI